MGGCCSSDEHNLEHYQQNQPVNPGQQPLINYGPLVRDEENIENLPNIVAFGKEVALIDEPVNPQENLVHDGQQYLMQSRVQNYDFLEPVEKSFRAVIASPERTNRVRYVNQVQDGAYVSEPLSDTQKDTRSMELNKNLRTNPLTNQVFPGSAINQSSERPFYNAATNSIVNRNQSSNIQSNVNQAVLVNNRTNVGNITNTLNGINQLSSSYNPSAVIARQLVQDDGHLSVAQQQQQSKVLFNSNNIQQQAGQLVQSQYASGQTAIAQQLPSQVQQIVNIPQQQQQQQVIQQTVVSQLPTSVQQQISQPNQQISYGQQVIQSYYQGSSAAGAAPAIINQSNLKNLNLN